MNLSRRGFFKGVAALFAGAVAAQLPSCSTGGMTPAVAAPPASGMKIAMDLENKLHPLRFYKGNVFSSTVSSPAENLITIEKLRKINMALRRNCMARRMLPYSTEPLVEGLTPLPENLLAPGPRAD